MLGMAQKAMALAEQLIGELASLRAEVKELREQLQRERV